MRKLILIWPIILLSFINCKSPESTEPLELNWADYEIMYERVYPVVNPSALDPSGNRFSIYHGILGGTNSSRLEHFGGEKWIAEATLEFHKVAYYLSLIDEKVIPKVDIGQVIPEIAWKISMRKKGNTEWTVLTCVEKHSDGSGEWTKVLLTKNGIQIPSSN